jgi:hypothetical protein
MMMTSRLKYSAPREYSSDDVQSSLARGSVQEVAEMLVGITLNQSSYEFAYPVVSRCAASDDPSVRGTAILCLGHLARIHGAIDAHPMIEQVCAGLCDSDEWVRGQASNAVDDISMFAPSNVTEELNQAIRKQRS